MATDSLAIWLWITPDAETPFPFCSHRASESRLLLALLCGVHLVF